MYHTETRKFIVSHSAQDDQHKSIAAVFSHLWSSDWQSRDRCKCLIITSVTVLLSHMAWTRQSLLSW